MINTRSTYMNFVKIHRKPGGMGMYHRMHGSSSEIGFNRFLPWHRAMLLEFENEMRKYIPDITLPY